MLNVFKTRACVFKCGGVSLKTLFVYCSDDAAINALCRESAFKKSDAKSIQLTTFSRKSLLSRCLGAVKGDAPHHKDCTMDINDFERVIIACDEFAGIISPEVVDFIKGNNFRYKNVDCIVFGEGRGAKKAKDSLKVCISLSGGTVRNCVSVSAKEIKQQEEDLLFSVRHRIAV